MQCACFAVSTFQELCTTERSQFFLFFLFFIFQFILITEHRGMHLLTQWWYKSLHVSLHISRCWWTLKEMQSSQKRDGVSTQYCWKWYSIYPGLLRIVSDTTAATMWAFWRVPSLSWLHAGCCGYGWLYNSSFCSFVHLWFCQMEGEQVAK